MKQKSIQILKKSGGFSLLQVMIMMAVVFAAMMGTLEMMKSESESQLALRLKASRNLLFAQLLPMVNDARVLIASSGMANNSPFFQCIGDVVNTCPSPPPSSTPEFPLLSPVESMIVCTDPVWFAKTACVGKSAADCNKWILPATGNPLKAGEMVSCFYHSAGGCKPNVTNLSVIPKKVISCSNKQNQNFALYNQSYQQVTYDAVAKSGGYYDSFGNPCNPPKNIDPEKYCHLKAVTTFTPIPNSGPPFAGVQVTLTVSGTKINRALGALVATPSYDIPVSPPESINEVLPSKMIAAFVSPSGCPKGWISVTGPTGSTQGKFLVGYDSSDTTHGYGVFGSAGAESFPNAQTVSGGGACSLNTDNHWAMKFVSGASWDILATDTTVSCSCVASPGAGRYSIPYLVVQWCSTP